MLWLLKGLNLSWWQRVGNMLFCRSVCVWESYRTWPARGKDQQALQRRQAGEICSHLQLHCHFQGWPHALLWPIQMLLLLWSKKSENVRFRLPLSTSACSTGIRQRYTATSMPAFTVQNSIILDIVSTYQLQKTVTYSISQSPHTF